MDHGECFDDDEFGFDFETFSYTSRQSLSSEPLNTQLTYTYLNSHSGEGHFMSSNLASSPNTGATPNHDHNTEKTQTNVQLRVPHPAPASSRCIFSCLTEADTDVSSREAFPYAYHVTGKKEMSPKHSDNDYVYQRRKSVPQMNSEHAMDAESEARLVPGVRGNGREYGDSCGKSNRSCCVSAEENLERNLCSWMCGVLNDKQSSEHGVGAHEHGVSRLQYFSNEDVDNALMDILLTPETSELLLTHKEAFQGNCLEEGDLTMDDIAFAFSGDETVDKLKLQVNYFKRVISKMKLLRNVRDHSLTKIGQCFDVSGSADVQRTVSSTGSDENVDRIAGKGAFENSKAREVCRCTSERRSTSEGSSWSNFEKEKYRLSARKHQNPETAVETLSGRSNLFSVEKRQCRFSCHTRGRRRIFWPLVPQCCTQTFQETCERVRCEKTSERRPTKWRVRRNNDDRREQCVMFAHRNRRKEITADSSEYKKAATAAVFDTPHNHTSSSGSKQHANMRCAEKSVSTSKLRAMSKAAETDGRDCLHGGMHSSERREVTPAVVGKTNSGQAGHQRKHSGCGKHKTQAYKRPIPITFDGKVRSEAKMLVTTLHCLDPRAKLVRQSNNNSHSLKLEVDQKLTNTKDEIERRGRWNPVPSQAHEGILQNVRDTVCCTGGTLATDTVTLGPGSSGQRATKRMRMETPISKKCSTGVERASYSPKTTKQELMDFLGEFCLAYRPLSPVPAEGESFNCFEDAARKHISPIHSKDADVAQSRNYDIGGCRVQPMNPSSLSVPCAGAIQYEVCGITVTQLFGTSRNPGIRPALNPQLSACSHLHSNSVQGELRNCVSEDQEDKMTESVAVSESSAILQPNRQQKQRGSKVKINEIKPSSPGFSVCNQPCSLMEVCICCMKKNPLLTARIPSNATTITATNSNCFNAEKYVKNKITLEIDRRQMGTKSKSYLKRMLMPSDSSESKLGTISTSVEEYYKRLRPDKNGAYTGPHSLKVDNINNSHGCVIGGQRSTRAQDYSHGSEAQSEAEGQETFICDDISSPIVLNACDRVYHVSVASTQRVEHSEHVKPGRSLGATTSLTQAAEALETEKYKKDKDNDKWTGQEETGALSENYRTSREDSQMDVLTVAMKSAGLTNDFLQQFFISDVLLENFLCSNALGTEHDCDEGENFIDSLFPEDEEQENFLGQGSMLASNEPLSKIVMSTQSNSNQPGCSRTFSLSSAWAEESDTISFPFQDFQAIAKEINDASPAKTTHTPAPYSGHRYHLRHLSPGQSSTLLFYEDDQLSQTPIDTCGFNYQDDDNCTRSLSGLLTKMNRENLSCQDKMHGASSDGPTFSRDPDQMNEALGLLPPIPPDEVFPDVEAETEMERSKQATCDQQTRHDIELLEQREQGAPNYFLNSETECSPQRETFDNDIGRRRRELIKRCHYGKITRATEGMMTRAREATEEKSKETVPHCTEVAEPPVSDSSDFLFTARTLIFHQDGADNPKEAKLETKNSLRKRKRKKNHDLKGAMQCNEFHEKLKNSQPERANAHSCVRTRQRRNNCAVISGRSSVIPAQAGDSPAIRKKLCNKRMKCMKSAHKNDDAPVTKFGQRNDVEIANKFTRQLKHYCPRLIARSRTMDPCRVLPRKLQTPLVVRKTYQGALRSALKNDKSPQSSRSQHLPMDSNNNADDDRSSKTLKKTRQLNSAVKCGETTRAEVMEESEATIKRRLKQLHTRLTVEYASQSQSESLGGVPSIVSLEAPLLAKSLAKIKRSCCEGETSSPVAHAKDKCPPFRWSGGEAGIDRGRLGVLNFVSRLHTKYGEHFARAHNISKDALNTMCFKYLDYQGVPPQGESHKSQDEAGTARAETEERPLKKTSTWSSTNCRDTGKTFNSNTQLRTEARFGVDARSNISKGKKENRKSAKNKKEEDTQPSAGDRPIKNDKGVFKFKYAENIMKAPPLTRISPLPPEMKTSDERESRKKEMENALPLVGPPSSSKGKNVNVNRRQRRAVHSKVGESLNLKHWTSSRVQEEENDVVTPKKTSLACPNSRKVPEILSANKKSNAREDPILKPSSASDQELLKVGSLQVDSLSCSDNEARAFASNEEDEPDVEFRSLLQLKEMSEKDQTLFGLPNLITDKGTKRYDGIIDTFLDHKRETQVRPYSKIRRSILDHRKTNIYKLVKCDKTDTYLTTTPRREEFSDSRASSTADSTVSQEEALRATPPPQSSTTDLSSTSSSTAAHASRKCVLSGLQEKCSEYQSRAARAVQSEDCAESLDLESVVSLTELKQMVHKTAFPEWMEEMDEFLDVEKKEVGLRSVKSPNEDWDFRACAENSDKQRGDDYDQDISAILKNDDFWETGSFSCREKRQGDGVCSSRNVHQQFTIDSDLLTDYTDNAENTTVPPTDYTRQTEDGNDDDTDDDKEFWDLGLPLCDSGPAKYSKMLQAKNDMEKKEWRCCESTDNSFLYIQPQPTVSQVLSHLASKDSSEKSQTVHSFSTLTLKHTITAETQDDIARQCSGNSTFCSGEIDPDRFPLTTESNHRQPNNLDQSPKSSDFPTPPAVSGEAEAVKDENETMDGGKNEFDFVNDMDRYELEPLASLKSVVTKSFDEAFSDFPFIGPGINTRVRDTRSSTLAVQGGNIKEKYALNGSSNERLSVSWNRNDVLDISGNRNVRGGLTGNSSDKPSVTGNRSSECDWE